jgi:membrane associated rhomboid family serine protease
MRALGTRFQEQATILFSFVALLWVLELADQIVFHRSLDRLGIHPRSLSGLWGILFSPFLHAGFGHLIANTIPLLVLGWLVMLRRTADFFIVTLVAMLLGGLGVWLVGPPSSVTIGASGLIFGYLGYSLLLGFFERSLASILIAIVVGFLYGGAIWGVLPSQPGISWQAHLFGFLSGALAAKLMAQRALVRR